MVIWSLKSIRAYFGMQPSQVREMSMSCHVMNQKSFPSFTTFDEPTCSVYFTFWESLVESKVIIMSYNLGFIGGGNMSTVIFRGILKNGLLVLLWFSDF